MRRFYPCHSNICRYAGHGVSRGRGFTLIELMITVAVLATILAIGAPSLQAFVASSRLRSATHELYSSLQTARMEAIRRNERVTVCKASTTSSASCTNTTSWHEGWIVFIDRAPGSEPQVSSADTILEVHPPIRGDIVIRGNGGTNGTASYVSFTADGGSKQLNGAFLAGTIRVCSTSASLSNDNRARELTINAAGRVISKVAQGVAATCPAP